MLHTHTHLHEGTFMVFSCFKMTFRDCFYASNSQKTNEHVHQRKKIEKAWISCSRLCKLCQAISHFSSHNIFLQFYHQNNGTIIKGCYWNSKEGKTSWWWCYFIMRIMRRSYELFILNFVSAIHIPIIPILYPVRGRYAKHFTRGLQERH